MNRLGMLVDISHVSDKTFYDVLETTRAPVIASHSSARALTNIPRNMSDEMLRALARNGGVVMVNFGSWFVDQNYADAVAQRRERLGPQLDALRARYANDPLRLREETERLLREHPIPRPPLSRLIDHIDHIVKVAGIDHVGLGSDFDGVDSLPEGLDDCSKLPLITYELLKRGYSERDIKKILGENFLRVFARAEEVARQMQREHR
jgi:membrane dipeptidase